MREAIFGEYTSYELEGQIEWNNIQADMHAYKVNTSFFTFYPTNVVANIPTKPILRSFLTLPKRAALINLSSLTLASFFLFFGGMVAL